MNRHKKTLLIAAGVLVGGFLLIKLITLPPLVRNAKLVEIPEKANAAQIAWILQDEHVIRSQRWFLFWTHRTGAQNKLEAGVYEFYGRTPLRTVIRKLVKGQVAMIRITVPEGSTCADIGRILEAKKVSTREEFQEYAAREKLEGYLFPDTYLFPLNVSKETVANKMLATFRKKMEEYYGDVSRTNEAEVRKLTTVASIIEKEAELDSERPIIASIIYNRLRKRMPLQCCATVEYTLGKHKSRLTASDLRVKSPYNTYLHYGLPPAPICNPGGRSLLAAFRPSRTDYLFFVTKGDGSHFFSRTHAEHLAARRQFLDAGTPVDTAVQ